MSQINVNRTGPTYTVTFSNTGADFVVGEVISPAQHWEV